MCIRDRLAANIDDMTGEAFGYLMERLMAEGALDVSFVPLTMKKSRPGLMAQVVARVEDEEKLGNLLLNESTTLGVRISHMRRMMQKRRFERVSTEYGEITVKIAEGTGRACPEYEQAAALARANHVPYLDVYNAAMSAYECSKGEDGL